MTNSRRDIPHNPPRWKPNQDPASIHVPGLDTSAAVHDQIEQIEQLITLKLQNIDENFSKIHHILANKVLPALKKYAVATEPVREAAKFWTSFYEQAAQIQIPTYDEFSTTAGDSDQTEIPIEATEDQIHDQSPSHAEVSQSQLYEPSMASTNESFMPGHAAFSSTPATARVTRVHDVTVGDPSWAASLIYPLSYVDPNFQASSAKGENTSGTTRLLLSSRLDEPTPIPKSREPDTPLRTGKGKGKDTNEPLLRNVLRHNLYSTDTSSTGSNSVDISPMKYRGKPKIPVPKKYNPFLPPGKDPSTWDGVVDLVGPSVMTPHRVRRGKAPPSGNLTLPHEPDDDDDEYFDGLPPGMSPPVMMSPARPPRSSAELGLLRLGQTPLREASERVTRDLVRDIQYRGSNATRESYVNSRVESTLSTIPTPPSFSRYHRTGTDTSDSIVLDSSLESMMLRVGLNIPSTIGSTPGLRLRSNAPQRVAQLPDDMLSTPPPPNVEDEPMTPIHTHEQIDDLDSDSDSMDEVNTTAHPSAAFLMASAGHGRHDSDDSFGSSNHSSDSLNDEDANIAPVHPFAMSVEDDGFDDSYDDSMYDLGGEVQEETLFGVPPQQRMQARQRPNMDGGDRLRMLGEDLLQDTIGISTLSGRVEETPTPTVWPGASRH